MGSATTVYMLRTVTDKLPFGGYTYGSLPIAKDKARWFPGTEVVAVDVASLPVVPEPDTTLDEALAAFKSGETVAVRGKSFYDSGSATVVRRGVVRSVCRVTRDGCDTGCVCVKVSTAGDSHSYVYLFSEAGK
jgi:hypothetical protein